MKRTCGVLVVGALLSVLLTVITQECRASDERERQVALLGGAPHLQPASALGQEASRLPAGAPPQVPAETFPLGAGDVLKVTVWGYPELSDPHVVISPDGTVSYPLIGVLSAAGLTAQDVAGAIGSALTPHLVDAPVVSVGVGELRSRRISVMGSVTKAGTYPLWGDDVTILEALATAGGLEAGSLPAEAKVLRLTDRGMREVISVNLHPMLSDVEGMQPDVILKPGDIVYVPNQAGLRKVCVLGEVNAPGLYTLTPSMTVVEALTAAGWVKPSGVIGSVMVARRETQEERQFFRINARRIIDRHDWSEDLALRPGDIVYVPEHLIAKIGDFVSFFSSKVEPVAAAYLRVYDATDPASYVVDR